MSNLARGAWLSAALLASAWYLPAKSASQEPAAQPEETFACPMHLDVRAAKAGVCPRCGMALVPMAPAVPEDFDLELQTRPSPVKPGRPARLGFTIKNPRTGEPVSRFGVQHDKLFHLFVVSQDLADFQHIHPALGPDGRFWIDTVLPRPGHYKVYADIYPLEGAPQVLQRDLVTAGLSSDLYASRPRLEADSVLTKTAAGIKVDLLLDPDVPIAGRAVTLKYTLTDAASGAPVADLVPYLAAWGHTLMLSEDQRDYVHSHPLEALPAGAAPRGGPHVTFEALMPRPGLYRVWSQFLRAGKSESEIATVSFTLKARRLGPP